MAKAHVDQSEIAHDKQTQGSLQPSIYDYIEVTERGERYCKGNIASGT
jgi:hypothetical protein